MKTPDKVKDGLIHCTGDDCTGCPYRPERDCSREVMNDSFARIQLLEIQKKSLEDRIDLMMIQMRTSDYPCPMCKHFKTNCLHDPCRSCRTKRGYQLWEYKDLPAVESVRSCETCATDRSAYSEGETGACYRCRQEDGHPHWRQKDRCAR